MTTDLDTKLASGTDRVYVKCANCSRMHPTTDEKGEQLDIPGKCRRCGCPMDKKKALEFADAEARKGHNPALTALGNAIRAKNEVNLSTAIKASRE